MVSFKAQATKDPSCIIFSSIMLLSRSSFNKTAVQDIQDRLNSVDCGRQGCRGSGCQTLVHVLQIACTATWVSDCPLSHVAVKHWWHPADLLNGGSPQFKESSLDELDLSDAEAAAGEDEDDECLLSEEEEAEDEDAEGAAGRHVAKRSRTKDDEALRPTEDRYALSPFLDNSKLSCGQY